MATDRSQLRWQRLQQTLRTEAPFLRRQGVLVNKRIGARSYWYLRYYRESEPGRRMHRSLYVGCDEALLAQVRAFLTGLREEEKELQETLRLVGVAKRLAVFARGID